MTDYHDTLDIAEMISSLSKKHPENDEIKTLTETIIPYLLKELVHSRTQATRAIETIHSARSHLIFGVQNLGDEAENNYSINCSMKSMENAYQRFFDMQEDRRKQSIKEVGTDGIELTELKDKYAKRV